MAGKSIHITVSTPVSTVLDADVDFVLLRTVEGDMGILYGHEPSAAQLNFGVLRTFVDNKPTEILAVLGGFATVFDNRVTILTELAERPDQIEEALSAREKERAENKLLEQRSDQEIQRAEMALRRTLVQMEVSPHSLLKGYEEKPE